MQATIDIGLGRPTLAARRGSESDYMMRSEKRPGYRAPEPPKRRNRRRRPRLSVPYLICTFLLLLALFPVGLVMLWLRKIPWSAATKLVLTLAFAAVFVVVASFALTVPVENDTVTALQLKSRQTLSDTGTRLRESVEKADLSPEGIWQDVQDIAGHSIQLAQKGVINGVPALGEKIEQLKTGAAGAISSGTSAAVKGVQQLMYQANLIPTPAPTVLPTLAPTVAPEPLGTEQPTPAPTAMTAFYVEGDATYHLSNECPKLSEGEPLPLTVTEAVRKGMLPCEDCAVPEVIQSEPSGASGPKPGETPTPGLDEPVNTIEQALPSPNKLEAQPNPSLDPALVPTPSPTPTPRPTPSPTPIVLPFGKSAADATVYYTSNGKYYHSASSCGSMKGAKPHTLKEALDKGLKQCNSCAAPDPALLAAETVVWLGTDHLFHITDECEKNTEGSTLMTLQQAMLEQGVRGCGACGADLYQKVEKLKAQQVRETPVPAPEVIPRATDASAE